MIAVVLKYFLNRSMILKYTFIYF